MFTEMTMGRIRIRVSDLLEERGMSTAEFADKAGLHYSTALLFTRGVAARVDIDSLTRICDALNVTVGDILVYEPAESEIA